jgi:hypothetical protein
MPELLEVHEIPSEEVRMVPDEKLVSTVTPDEKLLPSVTKLLFA